MGLLVGGVDGYEHGPRCRPAEGSSEALMQVRWFGKEKEGRILSE